MPFITKINTYYSDTGIEIQEEELVSGKMPSGRPQYTALVTVPVKISETENYPQQISVKIQAIGIEDAFKKAPELLNKEIVALNERIKEANKKMVDDTPRIITPG